MLIQAKNKFPGEEKKLYMLIIILILQPRVDRVAFSV